MTTCFYNREKEKNSKKRNANVAADIEDYFFIWVICAFNSFFFVHFFLITCSIMCNTCITRSSSLHNIMFVVPVIIVMTMMSRKKDKSGAEQGML